MSAMIAMVIRLTYSQQFTMVWRVLFIISSIIATIYALYWDLCVDWGLLNRHSKNKWLRDKIILKRKYLYFIAMVSIIPPISTHPNIHIWDIHFKIDLFICVLDSMRQDVFNYVLEGVNNLTILDLSILNKYFVVCCIGIVKIVLKKYAWSMLQRL